ncbi:hypothetical protein L615_000300001280 [Nocardioides sp. J9]|nr:hypothetical protein L615_000300001280 [Nocardioides sp. J9]
MAAIPALLVDKNQQRRWADRAAGATGTPAHPVYLDVTA